MVRREMEECRRRSSETKRRTSTAGQPVSQTRANVMRYIESVIQVRAFKLLEFGLRCALGKADTLLAQRTHNIEVQTI